MEPLMNKNWIPLTKMKSGDIGTIKAIDGGEEICHRLSSLGLHISKPLEKVSDMVLRGPVVVSVHRRHVAVGFGMAKRIMVEVK